MENRPTLEDEWTDRIYAAFNKKKRLDTAKRTDGENDCVRDLVVMTKEQEEMALVVEEEKQKARDMCLQLFDETKTVIRACDIPFHGWTSSEVVMMMLEDVVHQECRQCNILIFQWNYSRTQLSSKDLSEKQSEDGIRINSNRSWDTK